MLDYFSVITIILLCFLVFARALLVQFVEQSLNQGTRRSTFVSGSEGKKTVLIFDLGNGTFDNSFPKIKRIILKYWLLLVTLTLEVRILIIVC